MAPPTPTPAVAYLRASTEDQRLSPEAQRATLEHYATSAGLTVVSWHVDQGVSSVDPLERRPGLLAALASLRALPSAPPPVLLVAKRDRLARDVLLARTLERAISPALVRSAAGEGTEGDAPSDQFFRTIIDGAAEYERALIRGRTKAALAALRARGCKTGGGLPYGSRLGPDGATLEPDPAESATVSRARALHAAGASLRQVARALAAMGALSRTGKPFQAVQVRRMLLP